ncbi:unnamed protein product [marine sediment metagenome]|uniref:Uncharacterized protein n=1 Tax=marine sediment metagenome TaxID=412755 RepID=X1TDI2_9ZZZZ
MPGSLSDWLELELLDHVLKTGDYAVPTNIYVALSTADPLDTGAGIAEPSGGSYARVIMNVWDAAVGRATENTNKITFAQFTHDGGEITHWAAYDAIEGGNFLAHGEFTVAKTAPIGTNLYIEAGEIDVVFNAGAICDNLANKLLDHVFKVAEYTPETNIYVALFTSSPTDTGQAGTEVSDGAYAREVCNVWDVAAAGASENTNIIVFTKATALWGTITHGLLLSHLTDAPSGTNVLIWATITPNRTIGIDDDAEYAAGAFDITLD